jgi:hypothetical protein
MNMGFIYILSGANNGKKRNKIPKRFIVLFELQRN